MKKNKITAFSAAAAILVLSSVNAFAYSDTDGTVYEESVNCLSAMNVLSDSDDGLYHPEESITRAEFVKMLVTAFTSETMQFNSTETEFTDVTSDHWAVGYIAYATEMGCINGYGNGLFGAEDNATYDQAIKMIVVGLGCDTLAQMWGDYPDGYLIYAEQTDIIDDRVTKSGSDELNRGDVAILLYNAMNSPINVYEGTTPDGFGVMVAEYIRMDGTGEYFLSPAIRYHKTYTLEGTFTNTSASSEEIAEGTVEFTIDYSRNFDNVYYYAETEIPEDRTYILAVDEDVDTDSLYLKSAKILVKKNADDEWQITAISIED